MRFYRHLFQEKNTIYLIDIERDQTETIESVIAMLEKRYDFDTIRDTIVLIRDISKQPSYSLTVAAAKLFAEYCKIAAFHHNETNTYTVGYSKKHPGLIGQNIDGKTIPYPIRQHHTKNPE